MTSVGLWTAVAVLGGLGAVLRYLVDGALSRRFDTDFPIGILVVNVSGALLLGVLAGLVLSPRTALLAGAAFLGAYTTFSTWMLDTARLAERRRRWFAVLNIVASVVLGACAAALGHRLGCGCDRPAQPGVSLASLNSPVYRTAPWSRQPPKPSAPPSPRSCATT